MPSIAILSGNHLCHNPRVIKEATALQAAGYEVEVFGGWFDPVLKARDLDLMANLKFRFHPLLDLMERPALRLGLRVRGRIAKFFHARTGCENHWQFGYFAPSLERIARYTKADLLIAHSEPALWALSRLSPLQAKLGVDMEDWFSVDLPPETQKNRPIKLLRRMEQDLLRRAAHTTCTSKAMSDALVSEYGCSPPAVVYNAFPWADRQTLDGKFKDRQNVVLPSIHWYSQTIGMDRGLDDLLAALPLLKYECEIHLRGKPVAGFNEWLLARLPEPWRKRIFIHPLVSGDELLSRIAEHDIGFAGEQKFIRNKDVTVSNKILHYLLAGLAVVASDTAGQCEIAEQASGAVRTYSSGDSQALAKELNRLLASAGELRSAKAAALMAAEQTFCWERQVPVLLSNIKKALS